MINMGLEAWNCFRKQIDLFPKTSKGYGIEQFPITVMVRYPYCCIKPCGDCSLLEQKFLKPKDYIQIGIDAEDYYRIKESEKKSG